MLRGLFRGFRRLNLSKIDSIDVFVFGGLFLLWYGLWLYKPWVSFSVVGFIVFALGILLPYSKKRKE